MMYFRNELTRRLVSVACFFALAIGGGNLGHSQPPPSQKAFPPPTHANILLIMADDLGYGELGSYGQTNIVTKNLDRLAREGMRFTSFYAGSAIGTPSRAALMLGQDSGHSRIRGEKNLPLMPEDLTVAQLLKAANYHTCALGKWDLGEEGSTGMPRLQGFDQWFGYLDGKEAENYYPPLLNRSEDQNEKNIEVADETGQRGKYSDDYFTEAALNFVHLTKPLWFTPNYPFFLYLAYTIPHANNNLGRRTGNGMEVPENGPYTDKPWPLVEKNKAAMISRMDRYVGALLDKLKEEGTYSNTIILFTSDNGPHKEGGVDPAFFQASGPLRGIKRDLYEGGIRVPLIVWWPGKIAAGSVSDLPCAMWDLLPTAAAIAGKPAPGGIQGISILPTLLGQTQTNRHEFLYWEIHEDGFKQAVRMGDWKAMRYGVDGPLELYDLKSDLGERANVAEKNPKVVAEIEKYLETARTEDTNWPTETAAFTKKTEYGK